MVPLHPVSTAAAIVNDSGCVLMVQRRDSGEWEPPGGLLELGESIEDGLIREVVEETGLVVRPERVTGIYKNMVTGTVNITFACCVTSGELVESSETSGFKWALPQDVPLFTSPVFAARLLDAYRPGAVVPVVRAHNGYDFVFP